MSEKVYLKIGSDVLPVEPGKGYSLSLGDYESVLETEAGTRIRELTRLDIPTISVGFECDYDMLQDMRYYKSLPSVSVKYFNPSVSGDLIEELMFVSGYKEDMLADTSSGGIWKVSFTLEDLCDV